MPQPLRVGGFSDSTCIGTRIALTLGPRDTSSARRTDDPTKYDADCDLRSIPDDRSERRNVGSNQNRLIRRLRRSHKERCCTLGSPRVQSRISIHVVNDFGPLGRRYHLEQCWSAAVLPRVQAERKRKRYNFLSTPIVSNTC